MKIGHLAAVSQNIAIPKTGFVENFCTIEDDVVLGENLSMFSNAVIKAHTQIADGVQIHHGAIVGGLPQDKKFAGELSTLKIGQKTIIREYVTINRGTKASGETKIGSNVLIMAYTHVAHDCLIHDSVTLANAVQMGGHVEIGQGAVIGGGTLIHQFVKIGAYAMVSGGSLVKQDVPPFIIAAYEPLRYVTVNKIGLERAGFKTNTIKEIQEAYQLIFEEKLPRQAALQQLSSSKTKEIQDILAFMHSENRGILKGKGI